MDVHLFDVRDQDSGAELYAESYLVEPGGKGTNQARAAAVLGAGAVLVGRTGDDEFGRLCQEAARADGVETKWVRVDELAPTGFVAIRLIDGQHKTVVYAPGANLRLSWSDVEPALPELESSDVVITQTEVPAKVMTYLCNWARDNGVPLFLDPASPREITLATMRAVDVITPDLAEAEELVGRKLDTEPARVAAVGELLDLGVRRVVLKMGSAGALLADAAGVRRIETIPVVAVDETGAGDVFLAALAVQRATGSDWDEATRFANVASALSVSRTGFALPGHDEVLAALGGRDG